MAKQNEKLPYPGTLFYAKQPKCGMTNVMYVVHVGRKVITAHHLLDDLRLPGPPITPLAAGDFLNHYDVNEWNDLMEYWSTKPSRRKKR